MIDKAAGGLLDNPWDPLDPSRQRHSAVKANHQLAALSVQTKSE